MAQSTLPETEAPSAVVFYDGACPMCRREIALYRRLRGAANLSWIDIARDDAALQLHGLHRDDAMARLHVRDPAGLSHTGAWAFAEMWSHLPAYRYPAWALRRAGLLPLLDRVYVRFVRWRLQRRCSEANCTLPR